MGTLANLRKALGDDLGAPIKGERDRSNWVLVCVCGHPDRFHPSTIGGTWPVPEPVPATVRGSDEPGLEVWVATGCVGAMPLRNFETVTSTVDRPARRLIHTHNPTCPCTEFRPVARVDRPNRYFCQRVHADRHPLLVGCRALLTHLGKLKRALADGTGQWAEEEFDRRFVWIEKAQRCSISGCKATGPDVLPAYVNGDRHSDMRCAAHRD